MYNLRKEDLTKESCFIEARNVTNNIMKLVRLEIDRAKGVPVDDDIEYESDSLTYNNLKLKTCILREVGLRRAHETAFVKRV